MTAKLARFVIEGESVVEAMENAINACKERGLLVSPDTEQDLADARAKLAWVVNSELYDLEMETMTNETR